MCKAIHMIDIKTPFGERGDIVHPVLIQDDMNLILVDCGYVGSLADIEAELMCRSLQADQVTGLVLTHHDHDHMGAAAAFKRKYPSIKIYASELEAPYISAQKKPLRLVQAENLQESLPEDQQAFGRAFCDLLRQVEPVQVDVLLHDGDCFDWCGGCRVIAAPGHTPGHIALYLPTQKILIAGDAIALENGEPVLAKPQFALDLKTASSSMSKLLNMDADVLICYHGGRHRILK